MSTSDPRDDDRPTTEDTTGTADAAPAVGETDATPATGPSEASADAATDEPSATSTDEPAPVAAAEPAPADEPTAETTAVLPADEAAPTTEPSAPEPLATEPAVPEPSAVDPRTDSGRHATARPVPLPPEPAPARTTGYPVVAATPAPAPAAAPPTLLVPPPPAAPTPPVDAVPAPGPTYPSEITPEPPVDDGRLFPPPNAPRTPTLGTHVLGVIVGLFLGPIAVAGVLLGQARILAAQADHWDASLDVLGIVLVSCGLVLLACLVLLGLWTATVPITGGVVLSVLGGFALYAPGITRREVLHILTSQGWHTQVTQVTVVGTSGTLVVAGFLVLFAGILAAYARRHGIHLGEFRERNRA